MATNDFLQFGTDPGANVETQSTYAIDSKRTAGNQPGIASSSFNNKALRQANFVSSNIAQMMSDFTGVDVLDDTVTAKFLATLKAAVQILPSKVTTYLTGSGTHNIAYYFFIASGNATAAATYTNNAITFTVVGTVAAATLVQMTGSGAPSLSGTLTKTTGTGDSTLTFYAYRAPISLKVKMVGGGGGGGCSGTLSSAASDGTSTTFGSSLLVAGPGTKGNPVNGNGGGGGAASLGTGPAGVAIHGTDANNGVTGGGGSGGNTPFCGAGFGGSGSPAIGGDAYANTGSGGGGGGSVSTGGGGGGAGAYVNAVINSPASTYPYSVGTGGAKGTGTVAGGNGAAGIILIIGCYQ